jgi:hypothetical protein
MGPATAGKTGQREPGDHRVGHGKTDPHDQPQPENLSNKEKAKPANAHGFGVEPWGIGPFTNTLRCNYLVRHGLHGFTRSVD